MELEVIASIDSQRPPQVVGCRLIRRQLSEVTRSHIAAQVQLAALVFGHRESATRIKLTEDCGVSFFRKQRRGLSGALVIHRARSRSGRYGGPFLEVAIAGGSLTTRFGGRGLSAGRLHWSLQCLTQSIDLLHQLLVLLFEPMVLLNELIDRLQDFGDGRRRLWSLRDDHACCHHHGEQKYR
jgi:hypothetical protein